MVYLTGHDLSTYDISKHASIVTYSNKSTPTLIRPYLLIVSLTPFGIRKQKKNNF